MSASAPGLGDRADEGLDTAVVTAQLEDLLDEGAVLGLELAEPVVGLDAVAPLLDLDEEAASRVGLGGARDTAVQALERHCRRAARQPDAVRHACDGAHGRVLPLVLRHEQNTFLVADVDGQRHVHVWEDDDVVEWDEQQLAHDLVHAPLRHSSASWYKKYS